MKKIKLGVLTTCLLSVSTAYGMSELDDQALSKISGQALLNLAVTAGTSGKDSLGQSYDQKNISFYKLGLNAEMELNANIKKLQLGCGGDNGAGACDISIDHLSLSGLSDTSDGRAASSAQLTNPFIEFAIKNPDSAAKREVAGFRLSAEKVMGLLTAGDENSSTPNGINSLSGYMKIKDATGTAYTGGRTGVNYSNLGLTITGKAKSTTGFVSADFSSQDYSLNLTEGSGALFIKGQEIAGKRMTTVDLEGTATINNIGLSGKINANAKLWGALPIPLSGDVNGSISNLTVGVTVSEQLGFIHKLPLNNPMSLSLQSQAILWPGATAQAQSGWWMAFEDAIDIGNVTPTEKVIVTDDVIKQVIPYISKYLNDEPIKCGILAIECLGGQFNIGNAPLQNAKVTMALNNLQLVNQSFAPNCYGGMKFC